MKRENIEPAREQNKRIAMIAWALKKNLRGVNPFCWKDTTQLWKHEIKIASSQKAKGKFFLEKLLDQGSNLERGRGEA